MLNKQLSLTEVKLSVLCKIFLGVLEIPNYNILQSKVQGEIYIQIHVTCVTPRIFPDLQIKTFYMENISGIF